MSKVHTRARVFARFRYNDLKEAARVCGRCGLMAMGIQSFRPSVSYWFSDTQNEHVREPQFDALRRGMTSKWLLARRSEEETFSQLWRIGSVPACTNRDPNVFNGHVVHWPRSKLSGVWRIGVSEAAVELRCPGLRRFLR